MFFRQQPKPEGGSAPSKPKGGGLPFGNLIGEDAAKELFADDLKAMALDTEDFKAVADEMIKETLEEVPMVQAFRGLVFHEVEDPQPGPTGDAPIEADKSPTEPGDPNTVPPWGQDVPEAPAPQKPMPAPPKKPSEEDKTEPWPMPIPKKPPMPPPVPPRVPPKSPLPDSKGPQQPRPMPGPPKQPQEPGQPMPMPRPPQQPSPRPAPPAQPKPQPQPAPEEPGMPEPQKPDSGSKPSDKCPVDLERLIKAMEELAKGLEAMGNDILKKVDTLEAHVTRRSDEIRQDVKNIHQDAVDFSKKIKEAMHDAALKDLEIQKLTMDLLDQAEDKSLERAMKSQGLFGGKS